MKIKYLKKKKTKSHKNHPTYTKPKIMNTEKKLKCLIILWIHFAVYSYTRVHLFKMSVDFDDVKWEIWQKFQFWANTYYVPWPSSVVTFSWLFHLLSATFMSLVAILSLLWSIRTFSTHFFFGSPCKPKFNGWKNQTFSKFQSKAT